MALSAGDIAIVGFDTDAPDTFSFVLLVDVAAGEVISFTDNAWSGTALATNENTAVWTAPSGGLTKGTVIKVENGATLDASLGTVTGALSGLSASGDNIFAYQGTSTNPVFLFGAHNAGPWQTSDGASTNTSYLPSSLVEGVSAVALTHVDNYAYSGTTTGTQAQLLAAIGTGTNWSSNDGSKVAHPTSFTVQSGPALPSVNLSVSATTGTEAGTTVITVTATASAAVTGAQTVDVAVTGTGITVDDYSLSATQITIADGQTTGTVTFTIQNDANVEGAETATLTISNPSAGLVLGATTTQNVAITDDDATGVLAYTGQLNESKAFDGAVSGKITISLSGGETFTGADNDNFAGSKATITNVPAGLTAVLTRTSANTAELTLTGTAGTHTNAADVGNLTVTFANNAFTGGSAAAVTNATKGDLVINFGEPGVAGSTQTFTPNAGTTQDSSDASTAIALDANFMVVADDEASVLRVYPREGGAAVLEWSYASDLGLGGDELDLEASTRIGNALYFIGSHSNKSGGGEDNNREHVFAVTVSGSGADTTFTYVIQYAGLETALTTWDSGNTHGKGAGYFGFATSSATGVVPEAVNGFSIEGMTATQDGQNLLLAFRAPQSDTSTREKAVIVPVTVASVFSGTPVFGTPIELDLGGRGIRSIEKAATGGDYLILAGPAGGASTEVTHDFRLYRLDNALTTATELDVDLDTLRDGTGGSFETIVDVQSTAQNTLVQLLQDNGDTDWADRAGTTVSKDLPAADQKFQGNWVSLGADAGMDSTGPTLASNTPADNASDVAIGANLVLEFNEAVKAGAGDFVIKQTSDNSTVATIAANDAQVSYAFNTVTINPTSDLANGTGYYLEAVAGTVKDLDDNDWAGISNATTLNFTTVAAAPAYTLLITEVNAGANGGDFFELYNYGSSAIDLTGWKYDDDSASTVEADPIVADAMTLAAGERLTVLIDDASKVADFKTAWGLPAGANVGYTAGSGLGSGGDAVTVFDASGVIVASKAYTDRGANSAVSLVWDGVSTTSPNYVDATVNTLGAYAQTGDAASIGSPGRIASGYDLTLGAYTEIFGTNLGEFIAVSVDADASTDSNPGTWVRASGGYAEVNAFGDSAAANDWLISKAFDLSKTSVEYLSFTTWTRFSDTGITNPEVRLKYSTNYSGSGDPTAATWTELSYIPSADNSQSITPSGLIDLSAINGTNVYFAFQYTSSGTGSNSSSSWRVDDVSLTGYTGAVLSIAATDANKVEGNSGNTEFTFTVTRAGDTSGATDVNWAVTGSSANPADADDFNGTLPSGTVNFAANETTKTVTVNVSGDTTAESTEGFTVTLSGATGGASIVQATATGSILDDDTPPTKISAVQGDGAASALDGQIVTVEAIVTAYMPGLGGFFIQEEDADSDGNASTSEGVYVYDNRAVTVGDLVRFSATVDEYSGLTELKNLTNFTVVSSGNNLPTATVITLPVTDMTDWEAVEGMLVTVSSGTVDGKLVVTDNYNLGQYGQVTLTSDALLTQYTEVNSPSVSGNTAYNAEIQRDQLILDDGSSTQNPATHYGRGGNDLSASNTLRGGDFVSSITGVIDQYSSNPAAYETTYRIQPTTEPVFSGPPIASSPPPSRCSPAIPGRPRRASPPQSPTPRSRWLRSTCSTTSLPWARPSSTTPTAPSMIHVVPRTPPSSPASRTRSLPTCLASMPTCWV